MYSLFIFGPVLLQDTQLQDGQRIQRSLIFAAQSTQTSLLWLLADDQLVRSAMMNEATLSGHEERCDNVEDAE